MVNWTYRTRGESLASPLLRVVALSGPNVAALYWSPMKKINAMADRVRRSIRPKALRWRQSSGKFDPAFT